MRRLLIVLAVAGALFVITAEDALSRGGRGGGRGGGAGRGGGRSGRSGLGRSSGRRGNNRKSAKEFEELDLIAARLAEIEERRNALNQDSRRKVQEAYAFGLRLEAGAALSAELGSR